MKVSFDASTDEGITFLVKTMEERGFDPQGLTTRNSQIEEYTFWNVSNRDHRVRFFLKRTRSCLSCGGCYSMTETKNNRIVLGTQSCQWLKDPKLVRIEELSCKISELEKKLALYKEELKKLLE